MAAAGIALIPVRGMKPVAAGDRLAELVLGRLAAAGQALAAGDVVVLAQKVVSKAEGRTVRLDTVQVTAEAAALAPRVRKDPRLVTLILRESSRVVRAAPDVLIVRHRLGLTMANAGIDQSNVGPDGGEALLLPLDPDASAESLRQAFRAAAGGEVGVVISDSFGRPWRRGTVGVAIGAAGIAALLDLRGRPDMFGRALQVTEVARADEIAAAAGLVMGQADEAVPAVVVRGLAAGGAIPAAALIRPPEQDLFP